MTTLFLMRLEMIVLLFQKQKLTVARRLASTKLQHEAYKQSFMVTTCIHVNGSLIALALGCGD